MIVDPEKVLCEENECAFVQDGALLYLDNSHLSTLGSDIVMREMANFLK